jgi:mannose/fructose/N-acetylgalactosamine-specific phosphotransferase system component IIC
LADQWRAAGARATFNGWGVIVVGVIAAAVLASAFRVRESQRTPLLRTTLCLAISLLVTIAGTGAFALVLSWLKQGVR